MVEDVRGQIPSALWVKALAFVLNEKAAFRRL